MKNYSKLKIFLKKNILRYLRSSSLNTSDFPPEIWLENTNHCNATCIMCPREKQTRKKGIMDFDLYKKLIDEISINKNKVKRVHMHNFGEPLLDKKLPDRIKLAKDAGIKHVYFVTNASLLNEENSANLIDSGLDEFKISFYGIDQDSYNTTMVDLDFETTLKSVKTFFEVRKRKKANKPKVVIQLVPQLIGNNNEKKWKQIFENMINTKLGDKLNSVIIHNFGDGRDYNNIEDISIHNVCTYPWRTMVILQDGNISPCSHDFNGNVNMGNIKFSSIKEIWNSYKYTKMRNDFKSLNYKNYSTCSNCDIPRALSVEE
tara:strand:- start:275 stop:1225 length:951 start_codon:yes stop_codon:yes gene_type:complete